VALVLAGCVSHFPSKVKHRSPAPTNSTLASRWTTFPHCPGSPKTPWTLVADFPTKELESAGILGDCGGLWPEKKAGYFSNVTDVTVTRAQLDDLGAALLAGGWTLEVEDKVGTVLKDRDYYHGAATKFAIELYVNPSGDGSYTAFMDFHAPSVAALPTP
jgi:hypothetical protein